MAVDACVNREETDHKQKLCIEISVVSHSQRR